MDTRRHLLFDIDGTVLNDRDNLQAGIGLRYLQALQRLATAGHRFVFITGNDFNLQKRRILDPIVRLGLGPSVFCFSDGGSRAFEFSSDVGDFVEVKEYRHPNVMSSEQVDSVQDAFNSLIKKFVKTRPSLKIPSVEWYKPAGDYFEIRISPLKPSFLNDDNKYHRFSEELKGLIDHANIQHAVLKLPESRQATFVLQLVGRNLFADVSGFVKGVYQKLFSRDIFSELSKPELEKRGGDYISQIALKPFNDDNDRREFREIMARRLERLHPNTYSVLLGGRTTIDVQLRGVDKEKAIRFLCRKWDIRGEDMIYFGNEFGRYGNDLPVAQMGPGEAPICIVNVGARTDDAGIPAGRLLESGNGPEGTLNYLLFLLLHV